MIFGKSRKYSNSFHGIRTVALALSIDIKGSYLLTDTNNIKYIYILSSNNEPVYFCVKLTLKNRLFNGKSLSGKVIDAVPTIRGAINLGHSLRSFQIF
jgi:hypothetical protein